MNQQIVAGAALAAGLSVAMADTWKSQDDDEELKMLAKVMDTQPPSKLLVQPYAYFETPPYPSRWDRGTDIKMEAMQAVPYKVANLAWAKGIPWHRYDRDDDQTNSLYDMARGLGENWRTLNVRIFNQYVTGSTDADLADFIPNAPDGTAPYAAGRFGIPNAGGVDGNIVTGTGVASTATIQADYYKGEILFRRFLNTKGQPIYGNSIANKGYVLYYNVTNDEFFEKAFLQNFVDLGTQSAPSNVIRNAGHNVELWATPRVTTNKWYIFAKGAKKKLVFEQPRQPLREAIFTVENSDISRRTGQEGIMWDSRAGFGFNIPYGSVIVDQ